MKSNKLEMVKCAKFTYKYVPNKHMEKSINFPVKGLNGAWLLQQFRLMIIRSEDAATGQAIAVGMNQLFSQ